MAEELADTLTEEIVAGRVSPGESLPTEPELAAEFGVSRSVVRDATRMLAARGLVSVQHGRGAFVTESQVDAFADALLLALRRESASVWDVEEFFRRFWPEVFALAAARADRDAVRRIRAATDEYVDVFARVTRATMREERDPTEREIGEIADAFAGFTATLLAATENAVIRLIAGPFQRLRSLRAWDVSGLDAEQTIELEAAAFRDIVAAVEKHEPEAARRAVEGWFELPAEAIEAMRSTPVGETVRIPTSFSVMGRRKP